MYFRTILFIGFIFVTFLWGDYKNWKKYYPTILYFIICSLLYTVFTYDYPLWKFNPIYPSSYILPNNLLISIAVTFILFPCTALIYLGNFPKRHRQILYILTWVVIYSAIEFIALHFGAILYENGWRYLYSIIFNVFLFSFLRIHHLKPSLAWILSLIFILSFITIFNVPVYSV